MTKVINAKRTHAIQLTILLDDTNPFTLSLLSNSLVGWAKQNVQQYTENWAVQTARLDSESGEVVEGTVVAEGSEEEEV